MAEEQSGRFVEALSWVDRAISAFERAEGDHAISIQEALATRARIAARID